MRKLHYYKNLDGVRAIAALAVVVYHFVDFDTQPMSVRPYTEYGRYGVYLFFVLSGFVITRILINTKEEVNYFKSFYLRRILRIMPLYYFFLLVWYFILPLLTNENFISFRLQLPYYFYLQNIVQYFGIPFGGPRHFWTLAVEEHFYLIWPLIIYFIPAKHIGKTAISIVLLSVAGKYFMTWSGMEISLFTLSHVDKLSIGAFLAVLEMKGFFERKPKKRLFLFATAGLVLFFTALYLLSSKIILFEISLNLLLLLIFFGIIEVSANKKIFINKFLVSKPLQYLGRISYGIYVWHVLVLILLPYYYSTKILWLDFIICLVLTIIISHISFYYYEAYFFRFK